MEKLGKKWIKLECKDIVGPITLIKDKKSLKTAAKLTAFYAKSEGMDKARVIYWKSSRKDSKEIEVKIPEEEEVEEMRIL